MTGARAQSGFTMLELLVALAVASFLFVGMSGMFVSNHRAFERGQVRVDAQQNARVGIEMMTRELRMAGFDPSGQIPLLPSPTVFQGADDDGLVFLADLNGDAVLDRIAYRRNGDALIREFSSWNGSAFSAPLRSEIAAGLSRLVFRYFDGSQPTNVALTTPLAGADLWDVRRITIDMRSTGRTVQGRESNVAATIDVRPRNLP